MRLSVVRPPGRRPKTEIKQAAVENAAKVIFALMRKITTGQKKRDTEKSSVFLLLSATKHYIA